MYTILAGGVGALISAIIIMYYRSMVVRLEAESSKIETALISEKHTVDLLNDQIRRLNDQTKYLQSEISDLQDMLDKAGIQLPDLVRARLKRLLTPKN